MACQHLAPPPHLVTVAMVTHQTALVMKGCLAFGTVYCLLIRHWQSIVSCWSRNLLKDVAEHHWGCCLSFSDADAFECENLWAAQMVHWLSCKVTVYELVLL